jgi:hypothetical protein
LAVTILEETFADRALAAGEDRIVVDDDSPDSSC